MKKECNIDTKLRLFYGGQLIRKYREKKGLASQQLAEELNCTKPVISNIENGTRPMAQKVTPEALGRALDLTPQETDLLRILYLKQNYESDDYTLLKNYYLIVKDWDNCTEHIKENLGLDITVENIKKLTSNNRLFKNFQSEALDLTLRVLLRNQQFDEAIKNAEQAISLHNEHSYISSVDLHNNLAECYFRKAFFYEGQYEREQLHLIRLKVTNSATTPFIEAIENYRCQAIENFYDALNTLNKVENEINDDIHILNQLALTHYNIGKLSLPDSSISTQHLNKAVEIFDKIIHVREQIFINSPKKANVNKGTLKRCIAFKAMALAYLGKNELSHELLSLHINACLPSEESAYWAYINAIIYSKSKRFPETAQQLILADNSYDLSSQKLDKPSIVGFFTQLVLQEPDLQDFILHLMHRNTQLHRLMFANSLSPQEALSVKMAIDNER